MNRQFSHIALIMLLPGIGIAEPEVIYDSGQTKPMSQYLVSINVTQRAKTIQIPSAINPQPTRFPIRTPNLTPGSVESQQVNFPHLPLPVFILGTDDTSKAWLKQYRIRLIEAQAIGLIVNAENESDVQALQQIGRPLEIVAAPAESLAKQLNLKHYPVLISKSRIEQ